MRSTRRFRKSVRRGPRPFVVYGHVMSPMCVHCQNMQDAWKRLVKAVGVKPHDIKEDYQNKISLFDKMYRTKLVSDGFPTIFKVPKGGGPVQYYDDYYTRLQKNDGHRSMESMRTWLLGK